MKIRFLLDENLSPRLRIALKRIDPQIDILRVGDEGAPPLHTLDPEILRYLVTNRRLLVTDNRSTISDLLNEHYATGGDSHAGIVWVKPDAEMSQLVAALHLIWTASEAEEWVDRLDWIPF